MTLTMNPSTESRVSIAVLLLLRAFEYDGTTYDLTHLHPVTLRFERPAEGEILARSEARARLRDFFSSHIRNRHTRRAYLEAVRQFAAFCAELGIGELSQVEPLHVAAFVKRQLHTNSRPTVKQRLAALRRL